ncbi:MAG: 16S rRNA (uracil(1498)-N(3))-methyltransferase [Nannocystaceae bacterium]
MNLILVEPSDFVAEGRVRLVGRRLEHVRKVHRASVGDQLRVGLVDGPVGHGVVIALSAASVELTLTLTEQPPPPSPITLIVALPRPPSMHKVLQQGAAMGIKRFHFVHCARTEKSYWDARAVEPVAIRNNLLLGLEQARDTALPVVTSDRRFHRFVRETLPSFAAAGPLLVAHPDAETPCPRACASALSVFIGPEGGLVPDEVAALTNAGATPVSLGPRILRVETAVVALIARLSV